MLFRIHSGPLAALLDRTLVAQATRLSCTISDTEQVEPGTAHTNQLHRKRTREPGACGTDVSRLCLTLRVYTHRGWLKMMLCALLAFAFHAISSPTPFD